MDCRAAAPGVDRRRVDEAVCDIDIAGAVKRQRVRIVHVLLDRPQLQRGAWRIFCWVPLPFAVAYWRRLLAAPRGEYYFARHARHAAEEMACLASDVRAWFQIEDLPHLRRLYAAIDRANGN